MSQMILDNIKESENNTVSSRTSPTKTSARSSYEGESLNISVQELQKLNISTKSLNKSFPQKRKWKLDCIWGQHWSKRKYQSS